MEAFTSRNSVIVGLMQVGIVVVGVLSAAIDARILRGAILPWSTRTAVQAGILFLLIPLVWSVVAAVVRVSRSTSDLAKLVAFQAGVALVVMLSIFFAWAILAPWATGAWQGATLFRVAASMQH